MSDTLTTIRAKFKEARLARDTTTSTFLSTLIGEIESGAKLIDGIKTVSEDDVLDVLNSFKKKNQEFIDMMGKVAIPEKVLIERELIESLLPAQLTREEIMAIINDDLPVTAVMGDVMRYFKEHYNGMYDGKTLSSIVATVLKIRSM